MPASIKRQCPICQLERSFSSREQSWVRYAATDAPVCKKCLVMIEDGTLNAYSLQEGRVHHNAPDKWLRHGPPDMGALT